MTSYLLAGGGTAGHINPLLAIADRISQTEPDSKVLVLGTEAGMESRLVPERGYELRTIPKVALPRRLGFGVFAFPSRLSGAVGQVRRLIREARIEVVVGFGGFVSAPAYLAGWFEKVPIVIHEANRVPGFANRMGSRLTRFVGVAFKGTPLRHARFVGMPMRRELEELDQPASRAEARGFFGFHNDRPTLLVTGGSQGARSINETIAESVGVITGAGWNILHIVGMKGEIPESWPAGYHPIRYCDRMDLALAIADFAVSRAGSATIAELTGLGIPSALVPLDTGNGEQFHNASDVVAAGGALLVRNSEFNPQWVRTNLVNVLLDTEKLSSMAKASGSLGVLDGTARLVSLIQESLDSAAREGRRSRI